MLGITDSSGNFTSTRKYDVYGAVRSFTGSSGSKHKFVGQLGHPSEDETGLIYMRARYYDPVTGRFASEDPAQHGGNWYIYASNNPGNRVDFDGKIDVELIKLGWQLMLSGFPLLWMGTKDLAAGFSAMVKALASSAVNWSLADKAFFAEATRLLVMGGRTVGLGVQRIAYGYQTILLGLMSDSGGPPLDGGASAPLPV